MISMKNSVEQFLSKRRQELSNYRSHPLIYLIPTKSKNREY